jgi:ribosomal protein S18 acetylase RimI-like enzyme
MQITEYQATSDMLPFFKLIGQLYPKMSKKEFTTKLTEMVEKQGYKMIVVFEEGKPVGLAGYIIATMFYCDKYAQVMNIIVDKKYRQMAVGSKLLDYIQKRAKAEGCKKLVLDSYVTNKNSHKLYMKEEFTIEGFHFMKNL